jgi:hypothetical protein
MTDSSHKIRALFLAALICLVTVAGPVSLAGTAAATNAPRTLDADGLSSTSIYLGQELAVDVSGTANGAFDVDDGDQVFIYEIEDDGGIDVIDSETVQNGVITVDTELGSDGQYAINNESVRTDNEIRYAVQEQTFAAEWEDGTVTTSDDAVALELDSNRDPEYNVTIQADDLDYEELRALFVHPGTGLEEVTDPSHLPVDRLGFDRDDGDGLSELRSNGYITLDLSNTGQFATTEEIVANVTNLDAETSLDADERYEFSITVTDTTARDNATFRTGSRTAEFGQPLYTRAAGDVVEFSLALDAADEAWVQFTDPGSDFTDILYVEDVDDDGQVSFYANTRLIGTDHSRITGVGDGDTDVVYHSERDSVESYIHDEVIAGSGTGVTDATFYEETVDAADELSFTEYTNEVNGNDPTEQLPRPLQPADYELVVASNGTFVAEDGDPTVDDPIGSTEFDLVQSSLRGVRTWAAPQGGADDVRRISDLRDSLTRRDTVAIRDRAVLQFNATGLVGSLAAIDYAENGRDINDGIEDGFDADVLHELAMARSDWRGDGVALTFEGPDRVNRDRNELAIASAPADEAYVLVDQQTGEFDSGTLFLVVDSRTKPFRDGLSDGSQFDTGLTYVGTGSQYAFSTPSGPFGGRGGDTTDPAFPYFGQRVTSNVTADTTMRFEEPSVTFDATDDGTVQISPGANATVSGRTNLAPGTDVTVGVRLTPPGDNLPQRDPSFLAQRRIAVADDGSFAADFDLGNRTVGEEAYVQFDVGETTIETSDAVFRDAQGLRQPFFTASLDAPERVQRGDSADVLATITNTGSRDGTGRLNVSIDGRTVIRGVFDLEPGESRDLTEAINATGDSVEITAATNDDRAMATVAVDGPSPETERSPTPVTTATTTAEPTDAASGPTTVSTPTADGGGLPLPLVVVAVIVLLGAGVVAFQRWNSV